MKKYLKFKPHRHKCPDYRSSTMLQETQCKFQFAAEIRNQKRFQNNMGWEKSKCEFVEAVFNNLATFLPALFPFFLKINLNFSIKIHVDKRTFYKNVSALLTLYRH